LIFVNFVALMPEVKHLLKLNQQCLSKGPVLLVLLNFWFQQQTDFIGFFWIFNLSYDENL